MGLRGILVDRARVLEKSTAGVRIAGTMQFTEAEGPWFRARIAPPKGQETDDEGRPRDLTEVEMLFWKIDEGGAPVVLKADQKVEVSSIAYGSGIYRIQGSPQMPRKKRRIVVGVATLRRVTEPGAGV